MKIRILYKQLEGYNKKKIINKSHASYLLHYKKILKNEIRLRCISTHPKNLRGLSSTGK